VSSSSSGVASSPRTSGETTRPVVIASHPHPPSAFYNPAPAWFDIIVLAVLPGERLRRRGRHR
jgi:hypothetical protein